MNPQSKIEWRRELRSRRRSISPTARRHQESLVHGHVLAFIKTLPMGVVGTYLSVGAELDTLRLIPKLKSLGYEVACPVIVGEGIMEHHRLELGQKLEPGLHGTHEPVSGAWVEAQDMVAILVPGLGFTPRGGRLGQGKGFYDRYLDGCQTPHFGLSFAEQVVPELPQEDHDRAMNGLFTESGLQGPFPVCTTTGSGTIEAQP